MKFVQTPIPGAYVIDLEIHPDERGFFARSWCREEFASLQLNPTIAQCNVSFNHKRGTLRGLHLQLPPHQEAKVVRCTAGSIYDVVVDLRPDSPAYNKWFGVELTAANRTMLYVPEGLAHGFETLADNTEVCYQISEFYHPESARGVRWNDPAFGITWPIPPAVISDRDNSYPDYMQS